MLTRTNSARTRISPSTTHKDFKASIVNISKTVADTDKVTVSD